jgi:rRNA small subunit aminocarboxypropyltransferase
MGFKEFASRTLSIYKWGETFLTLNYDPLEEYSKATTPEEILKTEASFFPHIRI